MVLDITTWFTLGTAGMALGTVVLAWGYTQIPEGTRREYVDVFAVTAIATVAYGLMALGIGAITGARGEVVFVPRYVDWLLTTPLHVLFIGYLAGCDRQTLGVLAGLQAATIVLGFAGTLVAAPLNWVLFALGSVVFGVLVYRLYTDVGVSAGDEGDRRQALFRKLRNFVVFLWLVYPVIWVLSGAGIGLLDSETSSLVITYIDVVAKVGFGLIAFVDLQSIDLSETDVAVADQSVPADD